MKYVVYNQEGKEVGTTILPKEIFEVPLSVDLVHQVVVSQMANRRKVIAHTKGRGEVRGGGRKPWRQKGTGRARAGSLRSPLFRGGGVTFGPTKEKVFKKEIPKKMKRKALFMTLSAKAKNNLLILLDKIEIEKTKTKILAQVIENWRSLKATPSSPALASSEQLKIEKGGSLLIALPKYDKNIILAARNISDIETMQVKDINALDLLSFKYLIMPKDAIKVIKETFLK